MIFSKKMLATFVVCLVLTQSLNGMQQLVRSLNRGYGIPCLLTGIAASKVSANLLLKSSEKYGEVRRNMDTKNFDAVTDSIYKTSLYDAISTPFSILAFGCINLFVKRFLYQRSSMNVQKSLQPFRLVGAWEAGKLGFNLLQNSLLIMKTANAKGSHNENKPKAFAEALPGFILHTTGAAACGFGAFKLASSFWREYNRR